MALYLVCGARLQLVETDGAHVVDVVERCDRFQHGDLLGRRPPAIEHVPTSPRFTPQVKVSVQAD